MKKLIAGFLVIGCLVMWFFFRTQSAPTLLSTIAPSPVPIVDPTPVLIDSSTDLNKLLDSTTPEKFDIDYQNLTGSPK